MTSFFNIKKFHKSEDVNSENCNFHYFHLHAKLCYYCGAIPFKLSFNEDTGHYQLSKVNTLQKVRIKFLYFQSKKLFTFHNYTCTSITINNNIDLKPPLGITDNFHYGLDFVCSPYSLSG